MKGGTPNAAGSDPIWGYLALGVGLFIAPLILWHFFHAELSRFVLTTTYYVMLSVHYLYGLMSNTLLNALWQLSLLKEMQIYSEILVDIYPTIIYEDVTKQQLFEAMNKTGMALMPFILPIMLFLIIRLLRIQKPKRLNVELSRTDIIKNNCKYFPQIRPAIIENLLNIGDDVGPYSREMSPIRFAIINELVTVRNKRRYPSPDDPLIYHVTFNKAHKNDKKYLVLEDDLDLIAKAIHGDVIIDLDKLRTVFQTQLGERWTTIDALPDYLQALIAVFAARICYDRKGHNRLLDHMNRTWTKVRSPKDKKATYSISTRGYKKLLKKHFHKDPVQEIVNNHAYVTTVIAALLEEAQLKGKLCSPFFLWLKPLNRTKWYTLNNVGAKTAWSEAAGPFGHRLAEIKAGFAVTLPFLDNSVDGFMEYLDKKEGWLSPIETPEVDPDTGDIEPDDQALL